MVVFHRLMQRHGLISAPTKDRKCENCKQIFKSKLGLQKHQSRGQNPACYRAGLNQLRKNWIKRRVLYQHAWKKTQAFENHTSLYEPHSKGKALSAGEKQISINVYQSLRDDGFGMDQAITKAAKMTGI